MVKRNDLPNDEGQNLSPKEMKSRRDVFLVMIAAVAAILLLQMFNLQIVNGERYRRLSTENYLRITPIAAPRGNVSDRNGTVLITSRPSYSVYYWYLDKAKAEEALPRLSVRPQESGRAVHLRLCLRRASAHTACARALRRP